MVAPDTGRSRLWKAGTRRLEGDGPTDSRRMKLPERRAADPKIAVRTAFSVFAAGDLVAAW